MSSILFVASLLFALWLDNTLVQILEAKSTKEKSKFFAVVALVRKHAVCTCTVLKESIKQIKPDETK